MKHFVWLLLMISCVLHADDATNASVQPPLRVAVSAFAAPFEVQVNKNHFYGFDIAVMSFVCKKLQRNCIYLPMSLKNIYPTIANKKADLGISIIVISEDKAQYVQLSMPYMVSDAQFITKKILSPQPFTTAQLQNKTVGIVERSSFDDYLRSLPVDKVRIMKFDSYNELIEALRSGRIDFGLFNSHVVQYWVSNSSGELHALGEPIPMGYGLGIIANLDDKQLIQQVNYALSEYQLSGQFAEDYNVYLANF